MPVRHDSVMILDMGHRVKYWSQGAEALYGWSAAEAAGKDLRRLLKTRSHATGRTIKEDLVRQGGWEGELDNSRKDGSIVRVECRLTLERARRGKPAAILAIHNEVAPRRRSRRPIRAGAGGDGIPRGMDSGLKRAEDDLRQANERLELAHRAAGAGTWDWDVLTGRLTWCDHLFAIFGLDPRADTASFETWRGILHPGDREDASARIQQALHDHADLASEYRIILPDGQIRWIDARGRGEYDSMGEPVRMIGICIDITEKQRAQEALRESDQLYRAIGESIDYGVWVCAPDGRNIYASDSFLKLVGQTQQQCSDFGWGDVLHPDDAERTIAAWKECVRTGGTWDIEHRYHAVDGRWHDILARGVPVRNEKGEITCWAGINLDISALKQAHKDLDAARLEALNEKKRLEAVMEALPIGVAITDPRGGHLQYNRMFETIWGGPPPSTDSVSDYAAYKAWWADTGRPVLQEEWASAQAVQQRRTVIGQLVEIQQFDGGRKVILNNAAPVLDTDGNVSGSAVAIQDVTELRRMEQALLESEERLRLAQATAQVGIWDYHPKTGRINTTPEFDKLYGRASGGLLSYEMWRRQIHPDDIEKVENAREQAIANHEPFELEFRILHASGEIRWIYAKGGALYNEKGEVFRVFGVNMEITGRKRAEEQIAQLNQDLRRKVQEMETVFETVPIGIAIAEDPGGLHIRGNRANQEMLGVPMDGELSKRPAAGRAAAKYLPLQEGREIAWSELPMQRAVRGETVADRILDVRREDGSTITMLSNAAPLFDEDGRPRGAVGAFLDITNLMQAEEALRASEERYRSLVELSPEGVIVHQDNRFVYGNPAALRLYGADEPAQLIGRPVLEFIHPDDRILVSRRMEAALQHEVAPLQELRLLRLDGKAVPVESVAFPMKFQERPAVTVIIRDNSERNRMEAERLDLERFKVLSESRKLWQDTFDSITDLISIHDREGSMKMANRAFLEYFGLPPGEAMGKKCGELFHAAEFPASEYSFEESLVTKSPAFGELTDLRRSKIFEIHTFPLGSESGEISGFIQIAKDITERRESEIRLIVSERLAAVGQLAAGVAHEINNPLATISGCAEGLLSRIDQPFDAKGTREYLEIIKEEILRCKSITDGMLSFVRQASYEVKTVRLDEVLDRSIEMMRLQGRLHNVQVVREFAPDLPPVRVPQGDLMQVFLAIFSNALDAIEDRGHIRVRTGIAEGKVFAEVRDTGPGIPPEHAEKIFDLFFTTKSKKGGTGIGLPVARKLVGGMSGQLTLESGTGSGATFRVVLPAGEPVAADLE